MGGGSFVPKQQNWHWMKDDAAEPSAEWEAENTTFTMSDNSDILRMRFTINETGGKAGNNLDWAFEYSTNDADWNTPGADQAWNYANGQGTQGDNVTSNKCTDTTGKGIYIESAYEGSFDIDASTSYEFDYAITPGSGVVGETLYYFRILINAAEVVLNSGETHPNCTTAVATITLTMQDGTSSHSTDTIALTQAHTLVSTSADHALSQDSIALTQLHNIILSACLHSHAVDAPVLTQVHTLAVNDATHGVDGENPTVEPEIELIVYTGIHMTMGLHE